MTRRPLRIPRVLGPLLLACLPVPACTARDAATEREPHWVPLGAGVEAHMYLDSSRVEIADGKHTVWLWADYEQPDTIPGDTMPVWGSRTRHRLDCAARVAEDLGMLIMLDRQGARVDTVPVEGSGQNPFAVHVLGDRLFPLACQWLRRNRPAGG